MANAAGGDESFSSEGAADTTSTGVNYDPRNFILERELSEVHLLLDNLSADPDTTIEALSTHEPPHGLGKDWIEQICEISWPPPKSNVQRAEQAARLIRAKDFLNRLARPASGMSIAFTLMVTQRDGHDASATQQTGSRADETTWRSSLAIRAYPDLKAHASEFRTWLNFIKVFLIGWLVVTCLISWYVASGNNALADYATARTRFVEAQQKIDDLEAGRRTLASSGTRSTPKADGAETPGGPGTQAPSVGNVPKVEREVGYCERWTWQETQYVGRRLKEYQSADHLQACREFDNALSELKVAEKRPRGWLGVWRWIFKVGSAPGEAAAAAAWLTSLLGTAVLPVFYGLLGSAAAVVRSLSQKIRASTLTPRDRNLATQQLALGAVVGACIGLFIVGSDETLIGPVTLSGSAISFIAGFGVDAVFHALEALISRIFNLAPAAPARTTPAL
jgi:hypothetical protein